MNSNYEKFLGIIQRLSKKTETKMTMTITTRALQKIKKSFRNGFSEMLQTAKSLLPQKIFFGFLINHNFWEFFLITKLIYKQNLEQNENLKSSISFIKNKICSTSIKLLSKPRSKTRSWNNKLFTFTFGHSHLY